ncbi:MAG: Tm-1-like ATP-binding domain-containing protein [Candidatus Methanomethylicaceae archaeon]
MIKEARKGGVGITAERFILLIGALDTKGRFVEYLSQRLRESGLEALIADVSLLPSGNSSAQIDQATICAEAGICVEDLSSLAQEDACAKVIEGLKKIVTRLYRESKIHGIIGFGGTMGTGISTAVMRSLPLGIPKLVISTVRGDVRPYIGWSDITFFPAPVDFVGMNIFVRRTFDMAVSAIVGMTKLFDQNPEHESKKTVAITVRGTTSRCAENLVFLLEEAGFQAVSFHAIGQGSLMEELIRDGQICGVFDITPAEITEEVFGGKLSAGPQRMEAASLAGIPQVVSIGCTDIVCFGEVESIPKRFKRTHRIRSHSPELSAVFLKKREFLKVLDVICEKLNRSFGPVAVLIPKRGTGSAGWTMPEEYIELATKTFRRKLKPDFQVLEVDTDINDITFAKVAFNTFMAMLNKYKEL